MSQRKSHPIDCYIRPDSISEAQVVSGAKIWIKSKSLPPGDWWTHLVVFESHGPRTTDHDGSVLGMVALDRTVANIKIHTSRKASFDKVRAALVRHVAPPPNFLGKPPNDDDSTLLGDGNGRTPLPPPAGDS